MSTGLTLEVTTMAGGLSRLPNVSMEMTVAEIKNRKDWPLIGIPSKRQLVLFEGRMLDNFLSLTANHVRTEGGARICLSVTVAKGDQGSMSPQRLKYLQKYMEFSAGAKTQSQEDAQKRRQGKAQLLQEQRKREAEERRKEGILQRARDCEYYPLIACARECDGFDRDRVHAVGTVFGESSAALQHRLRCLAVDHGYVDAGERADVTATLKQRDWLITWCLTSIQKTGASIEHFLIDLRDSIGISAGDRSTATTFNDALRAARILQPGALPKEQAVAIRSEREEMATRVQMLEDGLRVEQLDHRAARGKATQLQLTADALTDEMTHMREEMAQMRATQADQFVLMRDKEQLTEQLRSIEIERDELRKHTYTEADLQMLSCHACVKF
jgi:hypothetical protein